MNFFIGKVEDILDPLLTGRVKLRILGDHTDDKEILPTEDLPWATPLNDIHSHSTTGKGQTPLGVRIDTCLLYTSPSPRDVEESRMPSSA